LELNNVLEQAFNTSRLLLMAANPKEAARELNRSLGLRALKVEGYVSREQGDWFKCLLEGNPGIRRVVEVGFNAGHSSHAFLSARDDISVVSFDICAHSYVPLAKDYLDKMFPRRHSLVIGDSRETLPAYHRDHPADAFDLAFIDGGHGYDVVSADLRNVLQVIHPSALIVMDDLKPWKAYGRGPERAWDDAKRQGLISELELLQDGHAVAAVRRKAITSAWAIGCLPEQRDSDLRTRAADGVARR
jgi:predicted O-methyltransferase YrrM